MKTLFTIVSDFFLIPLFFPLLFSSLIFPHPLAHLLLFFKINVLILFFIENLKPLLPAGIQNKLHTLIPCKKFDLSYDLNCHKLCSDFQEDIVFRFSLGWSSLVHRFLGSTNAQRVLLGLSEPIFQVQIFSILLLLFGVVFFKSGVYCSAPTQACVFDCHHLRLSFCVLLMWFSLLGWAMWNLHVCELIPITRSHFCIRYTMHSRKPSQKFSLCTVTGHFTYIIETFHILILKVFVFRLKINWN